MRTPCRIWTGSLDRQGYGRRWWRGQSRGAHLAAYEEEVGPVPEGMVLDHLCRVHACVNVDHLEPVTQAVNVRRGLMRKLADAEIAEIAAAPGTQREIAARFGISQAHVSNIKRGRTRS